MLTVTIKDFKAVRVTPTAAWTITGPNYSSEFKGSKDQVSAKIRRLIRKQNADACTTIPA